MYMLIRPFINAHAHQRIAPSSIHQRTCSFAQSSTHMLIRPFINAYAHQRICSSTHSSTHMLSPICQCTAVIKIPICRPSPTGQGPRHVRCTCTAHAHSPVHQRTAVIKIPISRRSPTGQGPRHIRCHIGAHLCVANPFHSSTYCRHQNTKMQAFTSRARP